MRNIRKLLVGTALAGALAAGVAAAPAASAATAGATGAAQSTSFDGFGKTWSGDRDAFATGSFGKSGGRHFFDVDLFDRDRDRDKAFFDFYYKDRFGWHHKRFSTSGHWDHKFFFKHKIHDYKWRVGHGTTGDFGWGKFRNIHF
ncbi:hypothetical protein [Streptosporangium sp. NPDC048865]|uniref:hypothetical protein n=1 Tax=Streptosporangium sp. NPDC048865 TaxID=3155766 RepID=UPI003443844D